MSETETELQIQIKKVITDILTLIIQHPEDLVLTDEIGDNSIVVTVKANKEDRGKIIGKKGNMIRSIRTIIRALASKDKVRTVITMID
jgi:predicted RNA-binding protein YlqC (UPF0109 family)